MATKTYALWTEQEIQILKEMAAKGYKAGDISKVLRSRTEAGISNRANAEGISLSPPPEIDMDEFKKLMGGRG